MSLSTDPYVWIAAVLTLGVFSFLYRDNPFFCFIEHLLVGLSTGYMFCIYFKGVFWPELIMPLWNDGFGANAHLWVPVVLCFLWACKYVDQAKDLYRLALAFWISVDVGLQIPTLMESDIIAQLRGTLDISLSGGWDIAIGNTVLVAGTLAALTYFYFSKAHEGIVGVSAKAGTWILMVGFGATFSYTILSRVNLLIGRFLFLFRDWLGIVS